MRKQLVLTILMVFGLHLGLSAQQRMRYSQYLQNPFLTNPALAGVESYWDIRAGASQQWVGIPGAPRSIYLTAHKGLFKLGNTVSRSEIDIVNSLPATGRFRTPPSTSKGFSASESETNSAPNFHLGAGFQLFSEQTGPISYNGLAGAVSAHIKVVGNLRLGIGANMELLNYRLNTSSINMLTANDIALSTNQVSLLLPSLNAGFALYSNRFFFMGSTRQLMPSRIVVNPNNPVVSGLETHYWFQTGLRLKAAEHISLMPSIALRQVSPAPPSLDLSLQANWKETIYLGMSYRHEDALVFLAGFRFRPDMRLDYAYDYTTSELRSLNSGSHSLVLSFFPKIDQAGGKRYFW